MNSTWVMIVLSTIITAALALAAPSARAADPWTKANTALEATYLAGHLIDYAQTLQISRDPEHYYEINPILGSHPSTERVHAYMVGSGLAHVAIAYLLPKPYREIFQSGTLMLKIGIVKHNADIGLQWRF